MEGRLDSVEDRTLIGEADVRAVFGTGTRKVAGCMVQDGRLRKGCLAVVSASGLRWHTSKKRIEPIVASEVNIYAANHVLLF